MLRKGRCRRPASCCKKALEAGLPPIVCINKIDRPDARIAAVLDEIFDLFIDLDANEAQLDFPVVYTNARAGIAKRELDDSSEDLRPLFELIVDALPGPTVEPSGAAAVPVQQPRLRRLRRPAGDRPRQERRARDRRDRTRGFAPTDRRTSGRRSRRSTAGAVSSAIEVERGRAGDIVAIAGIEDIHIGDTIADLEHPKALPPIRIDEPTIAMIFA